MEDMHHCLEACKESSGSWVKIMGYLQKKGKKKHSVWPLSTLKTVHWESHSSLSVQLFSQSDFGSKVWPPTTDSSCKVTYSPSGCVYAQGASLSCSIFCIAVIRYKWAPWAIVFWARNTTVSHNLKLKIDMFAGLFVHLQLHNKTLQVFFSFHLWNGK